MIHLTIKIFAFLEMGITSIEFFDTTKNKKVHQVPIFLV